MYFFKTVSFLYLKPTFLYEHLIKFKYVLVKSTIIWYLDTKLYIIQ